MTEENKLPNSFNPELERQMIKPTDALYEEIFGSNEDFKGASVDWRPFLPKLEIQAGSDCVSFSRNNCAEIVAKKNGVLDEEGQEFNFSDLYLAVGSGTTENGNSLSVVAEWARKNGVVLERFLPYDDTPDMARRRALFAATPGFAKRYMFGNWSRVQPVTYTMKGALRDTPLQFGIPLDNDYNYADIVPVPEVTRAWHAVTCTFIDEQDRYYIFDHYTRKEKVLAANYPIPFVLSFVDLPENWRTQTEDPKKLVARLVGKYILRAEAKGEMYRVFPDKLVKVAVFVSDVDMQNELNLFLRQNNKFLGISEVDFAKLTEVLPIK